MVLKLGLIGYPLGHSASPWIHKTFLNRVGLEGSYDKYEIKPGATFEKEVLKLKESGIVGFNVTVPHKESIIPLLDDLSEDAKEMGAVNTVAYLDGKWTGFNTDGSGYLRALETAYPEIINNKNMKILLLGAGGAARGIYFAFIKNGYKHIDIANRTVTSAESIQKLNKGIVTTEVKTLNEAEQTITQYDLIVQTSSVGMEPNDDELIITFAELKENAIVSDIVYKPLKTKFLQLAEKLGGRIHYGHTMLLYQAQYAFEIWASQQVSADGMNESLQQLLDGGSPC